MKIQQIGNYSSYDGNIIEAILKNRKVENPELFLNPDHSNDIDPFKFFNMQKGAETLLAHLYIKSKIGIVVDPDADGMMSSTILFQYINKIDNNANLVYFLHDTKAHGLTDKMMTQICETDIDLLIIPDAGSNDNTALTKIKYMGIDIIVIDHHEIEKKFEYGILINNQAKENEKTNKNLVGAGMTLKFCQAIDIILEANYVEEFYDLAAIGQIGDASDISDPEVRNIVFKGIRNFNNNFVKTVLNDCFTDISNLAPKDLSFSLIPLINSVVRVGTYEEKDLLFRALNNFDTQRIWIVPKKKKNKETGKFDQINVEFNTYEYANDICKKVKSRQASMVKKIVGQLEKTIDNSGGIAIGILESMDEGSVTGLVATKLVYKFKKPVLILYHIENKYTGSARGYDKVLPNFKDWCNDTGLVEFATGHQGAFGISIFGDKFEAFKEKSKEIEQKEFIYEVDVHMDGKSDKKIIFDIDENKHIFGGKVHEPLLAFTRIKVSKQLIRSRGSMLTFFDNGIEYVMFSAPNNLYEELTHNFDRFIECDFVGTASVSNWNDKKTAQIILSDMRRSQNIIEEITCDNIVF